MDKTLETPLRADAFDKTDEEKIDIIKNHFHQIMLTLGLDTTDDSLRNTPQRVAKMYVKELFSGLDPSRKPAATIFENNYDYDGILVEKNITLTSVCEHHFMPMVGVAHVGYLSAGRVIGLSKINRIVNYFARRPQVQERLTLQIADELKTALGTEDVGVVIDSKHYCVVCRGIRDVNSSTVTYSFHGKFNDPEVRKEFMNFLD